MEPVDDAQQRMSQPSLSHSRSLYSKRTSILTPEEQKDQQSGIRYVRFNDHSTNASRNFPSNQLRTAKYNALNMIPKALFEQFRRVANFYFLVIAIVSFVPGVSPSTPAASVLPLLVVVGFGFARDVYEDGKRAAEDRRQNSEKQIIMARRPESVDAVDRKVSLVSKSLSDRLIALNLQPEIHRTVASRNIAVGDIVFLRKGQVFPCDMVLLHSSTDGGIAYVSTANLDGESNLKRTLCAAPTSDLKYPSELLSLHGKVRAQQPATALYDFDASILLSGHEPAPLSASNLLLRGSILRNTSYVYGLAVYTGFDTKVALNMRNPPSKMGNVEKKLNWIVLILFVILAILISACSGAAAALQANQAEGQWYMDEFSDRGSGSVFARSLGTFLILFSTFIPVSLFVTLEFIRVIQALFMSADYRMKTKGRSVAARATNLNETLGEIEHILSDKTGTLTENEMRYIACSAGGNVYNIRKKRRDMHNAVKKDVKPVKLLLLAMALCHSVVPEPKSEGSEPLFDDDDSDGKKKKKMRAFRNSKKTESADAANANQSDDDSNDGLPSYQGQSPDEVALVTSARKYGIGLLRRTIDTLVIDHFGTEEEYTALAELEFNSDRKRMSMIFKCPDRKIRMYTKGADTIMLPLLRNNLDMQLVQDHIDEFAKEGLRTLVFAKRDFTPQEFEPWFARFQEASNSLDDREAKVSALSAEIETDLEFIATTAVEDKLQDKVPETIKFMREAGVKLWVLTGDKRETAENIGYSANLLDRDMDVRHIKGATSKEVRSQLSGTLDDHILDEEPRSFERARSSSIANFARRLSLRDKKKVEEKEVGIIIDGKSLSFAIEDHAELFMALSDHAKVVICCRVTPLQKALVVRLVREERKAVTLAIGDGGNDVSMIQEAHVGVGIYGKEGTQAARSADYAVGEFKHLLRLTALHGRFSVVRTAGMINLSFYKNIFFTLTQVLFQPFAFVSGVTFNNQWISAAFNVIVTSASPFLYGIFERDVDEGTALRFPSVYGSNRDKKLFSIKSFLEYTMLYGLWHAVVVFFGVYLLFGYLRIGFSDGRDSGLFLVGLANSTIVTLMTLFKILLHSHTLNWIVLLFMALSLGVYVAVVPLSISLFQDYPMEGQLVALFSSPLFYLSAAVIMVGGFVLDFTVLSIRQLVKPNMVDRLRVWERDVRRNKAA
ncbi:Phospholipid-transporting ATPase IA [Gracilariopsis chorda]|uniref:Phospholipid-transporting ATPase n=1 Tax=Gracilariopsis chorda TaxID=448386 RepID=A0A2V3IVN5_9FLOR|nr:Phospholipid-transporting ATPase IA [Gracilariopsis chorda]|eukprot:PXF46192.1 Phospholipid-transporting ATPase IA [Gracilariopsis chorda]